MGLGDLLLWVFRAARRADRRRAAQIRRNQREALAAQVRAERAKRIRQAKAEQIVRTRHRDQMILERRAGLKVDPKKHMRTSFEIAAEAKALLDFSKTGRLPAPVGMLSEDGRWRWDGQKWKQVIETPPQYVKAAQANTKIELDRPTVSELIQAGSHSQVGLVSDAMLPPGRVPRTAEELRNLLAQRPKRWEYLLFAALLLRGKQGLEAEWRYYESRAVQPTGVQLSGSQALAVAQATVNSVEACIVGAVRDFSDAAVAEAFGPPGLPGDPLLIEYLEARVIAAHKELLDIAARTRSARTYEDVRRAVDLTADLVDQPVRQIRDWIDRTVEQIDQIPELIARADGHKIAIDLTLTLSPDARIATQFGQEIDRLQLRLPLTGD